MAHTDDAIGDDCILLEKEICRRAPLHHEAGNISSISGEFEAAMADAGLEVPLGGVKADGKIHRCDVEGEGGKGDGAYQLHLDGIPAGWFQSNRDGASPRRWHARTGQKFTATEVAAYKEKARSQQAARNAFLAQQQEQTAKRAAALIDGSEDAPASHRYLDSKKVQAHGLRYSAVPVAISPRRNSAADVLIVPMRDIDGTLWNAQLIDASGAADFLKDGRVGGCFYAIGTAGGLNPNGLNLICEGFATAATCFEAMDVPAVVAFGCDNLLAVAKALRSAYPKARFILCGDDDWKAQDPDGKSINPGRTHAMNAARAIGGEVAFPVFSPGHCRHDEEISFNDLALVEGVGSVRTCVEAAETVETIKARAEEPANAAIEAEIERLAALSDNDYELVREDEAEKLGFRPTFLDKVVQKTKAANAGAALDPSAAKLAKHLSPVEPWPEAVDGGALLLELVTAIRAHVVMEENAAIAVAFWILHAHAHDAAAISAILAIISPQKRCGKTTLLSLLQELTPNPLAASNISASAVFRAVEEWRPTLIVDEADTFLAKHGELRGVLNSGHSRHTAFVVRVVDKKQPPVKFSTWAPKVIASIGALSDTLQDRSIPILLHRKLPSEKVRIFRADHVPHLTNLCRMAVRWATDNLEQLRKLDAPVPAQLHDRQADNWRAQFNIAELLGGEWPSKAREAALTIEGATCECENAGVRLLADCRTVFEDRDATELSAADIIAGICSLEESPWYRSGKPITERGFADILEPFGLKSRRKTCGEDKGRKRWHRTDFEDAWRRYLS